MAVWVVIMINILTSIAGSMLSLAIWFHYDLEGWWEHRRHARAIERGRRLDARSRTKTRIYPDELDTDGTLPGEPDEHY